MTSKMTEQLKFEIGYYENRLKDAEEDIKVLRNRLAKESGVGEIKQTLHEIEKRETDQAAIKKVLQSLRRIELAQTVEAGTKEHAK